MIPSPILHQAIPDGLREEWARLLARPLAPPEEDRVILMVFRLGNEDFGLPAEVVEEVVSPGVIRPLPHHRTGFFRGVTNIRGRIRLCIWLDRILKPSPSVLPGTPRLLMLHYRGWRVVAMVEEVHGLRTFRADQEHPLPATHAGEVYCDAWFDDGGEVIARVDVERLFSTLQRQRR